MTSRLKYLPVALVPFAVIFLLDRAHLFDQGYVERVRPGLFLSDVDVAHIARYRWAKQYCAGKRVADIACGTCYGMKILGEVAKSVDGYDMKNFCGNRVINLEKESWDRRYDVIVSFETIEHLANPEFFLGNVSRSCSLFLLSTPIGEHPGLNPYHKQFWTEAQLKSLLGRFFTCEYSYQDGAKIGATSGKGIIAVCEPRT